MIVQRAIYRGGERVADVPDVAAMAEVCRDGGGIAWIGLNRPTAEEFAEVRASSNFTSSRSRTRSRPISARSSSATATLCSSSCSAARYLDETEDGRVRRAARFRRPGLRDHRPARRCARPGLGTRGARGATPTCFGPARGDPVRDPRPRRRRLRAGRRRPRERHRRDRGRGLHAASPTFPAASIELSREVIEFQRATRPLVDMLARLIDDPGSTT